MLCFLLVFCFVLFFFSTVQLVSYTTVDTLKKRKRCLAGAGCLEECKSTEFL